jgi:DNA-binding NarL/FixJ family response regulator
MSGCQTPEFVERRRLPAESLTPSERDLIARIMEGLRNAEIARQRSVRVQTVKNQIQSIFDKLGVSDRVELILYVVDRRPDLRQNLPASRGLGWNEESRKAGIEGAVVAS